MSLTMAQGMKRLRDADCGAVRRGRVRPDRTSWFLNRDALQQAVEAQIRAVTGLDLVVQGAIDVRYFRQLCLLPQCRAEGRRIADPALQVDVLTANLRLLPLLLRRFEIADVMMLRPHIRVAGQPMGESNWTPFVETIARTMKPGAENQVSFSEIRIPGRRAENEDAANHVSEQLGDIDLSWPGRRSRARSAATGQFDWRNERVDGSISAGDFVAMLSGDRSGLKARLVSAPVKTGLRWHGRQPHQPDDGRHRHRRQPVAAQTRCVGWDRRRPAAAASAVRAEGPRQCRRRLDRIDECECRTRRQRRRRRDDGRQ